MKRNLIRLRYGRLLIWGIKLVLKIQNFKMLQEKIIGLPLNWAESYLEQYGKQLI